MVHTSALAPAVERAASSLGRTWAVARACAGAVALATLLGGCLSAATQVSDDTGGTASSTWTDDGDTTASGSTSTSGTSAPVDDDQDGWAVEEGDCDDGDPSVNPGAWDDCNGQDTDCDGEVDEDAIEDDATEPNDPGAYTLGDLSTDPDLQVLASLHNDGDVDRFRFNLDDSGWSLFTLDVSVSNIPSSASYHVTLEHLDLGVVYLDEVGGGTLSVSIDDNLFSEDSGTWELTVSSDGGADCASDYLVSVSLD